MKEFKEALHKNSKSTALHTVTGLGAVALKETKPRQPNWAGRLATLLPSAAALRQQSPGAVLFVEAEHRKFALTFGYGRGLLAPETLEHDFGIKTVLNSVDAGLIRSLDSRTLEVSPQMMRRQFIDERPLAAFSLDRMRDTNCASFSVVASISAREALLLLVPRVSIDSSAGSKLRS